MLEALESLSALAAAGAASVWSAAVLTCAASAWLATRQFRRVPAHLDAPFGLYPVSILKPLKGADEGLEQNLEGFFRLEYPEYELLFSVADERDPAAAVVRRLMARHPATRARLLVGETEAGVNPKVNNLVRGYETARHDWVLISDSNVRASRDLLSRLMAQVENGTGIVSGVVAGRNPHGVGGHLEAAYLNTFYARGTVLAATLGKPCVIGKCMLFRRSTAARFGGIRVLARYLAEDYMAGEAVLKLGLGVVTSVDPIDQHLGRYRFREFWSRHVRWGRIRKAQGPLVFAAEPLMTSMLSGALGAFAARAAWEVPPSVFMAAHLVFWAACDLAVMRAMRVRLDLRVPFAWLGRELLHLPMWLHVASGRTVSWRGRKLLVRSGGLLEDPTR